MRRPLALAALGLLAVSPARGAEPADDPSAAAAASPLGACLVRNLQPDDAKTIRLWLFAAISANPEFRPYVVLPPREADAVVAKAADVLTSLLAGPCRSETAGALKGGARGLQSGLRPLGAHVLSTIMTDPDVGRAFAAIGARMDLGRIIRSLQKDAPP